MFVVLPSSHFKLKATEAIDKNFRESDLKPRKAKALALSLLNRLNLERLEKEVRSSPQGVLRVFFTAKTHKPDHPLRAIVTEEGSWQKVVSSFLKKSLEVLVPTDPFLLQSSMSLVECLQRGFPGANAAFSVDVVDLFYSVPHDELFRAVRELIEATGIVSFQNACGITLDSFLELLKVYLISTIVQHGEKFFVQNRGICIGSCVAPVLCNIFFSQVGLGATGCTSRHTGG